MRVWLVRAALLLGLLGLGSVLWVLLAPRGLAWIVWTLGALLGALIALELVLRARRRAGQDREWERWQAAIEDAGARRAAIAQVRARIDRARRFGPRLRVEHARLACVLAELFEADGRPAEAVLALSRVALDELDPVQAAVMRHARAQAYLAAGDLDGAETSLSAAPAQSGDPVLDASLALARASVHAGRGRIDEAERTARAVLDASEQGDELNDEARVIIARCLADRGEHEAARAMLDPIDDAGRRRLRALGPALLREVLDPL